MAILYIFRDIGKTTWQNIIKVNKISIPFASAILIPEIHFKRTTWCFYTGILIAISFIIKKYHKILTMDD